MKKKTVTKVLRSEATWIQTACDNALLLGNISKIEHKGIERMVGWMRFHADNPWLLTEKRKDF